MRVQVTDQARVAIEIARSMGASATALVAALAIEPDGRAGHVLRERSSAATTLAMQHAPGGTDLDTVLITATGLAGDRPLWTTDLLVAGMRDPEAAAVMITSGFDVAELSGQGRRLAELGSWQDPWAAAETVGAVAGPTDGLDATASLVVGRVRARGGAAIDLLCALASSDEVHALDGVDPAELAAVAPAAPEGSRSEAPVEYDGRLRAVVAAAHRAALPRRATCDDLLTATLQIEHGGWGPRAHLDALVGRG